MSWLSLFLFLIMGGIIFFQSIHGLFSALIMAVICVLSATIALGAHEQLAQEMLYDFLGDYAYAAAFVGLFAVCTIVLRVALDTTIPRSTQLPSFVDKIGAITFGLISGFIATGVMGTGIQMLPFGSDIIGYQRLDEEGDENSLWLNPDGFTVRLCGWLADATTATETGWFDDHPNFLTELHWFRNVESTGSRISVPPGTVSVTDVSLATQINEVKPKEGRRAADPATPIDGPPGMQWLVVGLQVGGDAKDTDSRHRASNTQARLVGTTAQGRPAQYTLLAFDAGNGGYIAAKDHLTWGNDGNFKVVFEVPTGFQPRFIEYKRAGRADVKAPKDLATGTPPAAEPVAQAPRPTGRGRARSNLATTPVRPEAAGNQSSHFGADFPVALQRYTGQFDSAGEALASGHIVAKIEKQDDPGADPEQINLTSFRVPGEHRLLQLNVQAVQASTQLASAVNLTRRVLQQYRVLSRSGESFMANGMITEAEVGGERLMEIQYWSDEEHLLMGRSPLQRPLRVKHDRLRGDYRFVLLFLVPPGTEVTEFDSGNRAVDITDLDLVAPS